MQFSWHQLGRIIRPGRRFQMPSCGPAIVDLRSARVAKPREKKSEPAASKTLPMDLSVIAWPTRPANRKSSADRIRHRAPRQGPARRLLFPRDVTVAGVDVASFDRRRPQTPAPFAHATIQNHIPASPTACSQALRATITAWKASTAELSSRCRGSERAVTV